MTSTRTRPGSSPSFGQQVLDGDRDVADADAGGVVDGVGDRGGHADGADLADSSGADGVVQRVRVLDEVHVHVRDVGVHRQQVAGEVRVGQPTVLLDVQPLVQCRRHAPDHPARDLASGRGRVDDAAGVEHAEHAGDAGLSGPFVHADLDELGAERAERVLRQLLARGRRTVRCQLGATQRRE
jgi:hypothetical protein